VLDLQNETMVRWYFSVQRPQFVFFAAACVGGIAANIARPVQFLADNLQMELNVFRLASEYNVEKLLFVSTSCCYPRDCPQPMRPEYLWTGPLEKTTEPYSVAKLAGMKLCQYLGPNFISVLPCNIFGEGDNFHPETAHCLPGILGRMHYARRAGNPSFSIWGHPEAQREFLYAPDLARGLVIAMEKHQGPEPLNLGSGLELSMQQLSIVLEDVTGYTGKILFDRSKPVGTPRKLLDSSVARALGWTAETPFREAVERTYSDFLLRSQSLSDLR
jgi:GDP-L-fucose synthase